MTGKRITLLAIIALLGFTAVHVLGQGKKKKAGAVTAPTPDQLAVYDSARYHYFLFPQFYSYWPIDNNDTILKYECYDGSMNFISVDTLYNISDVQHISFIKTYTDYTQTDIDADGKPHPKLVMKKLYKYDRIGPDSWTGYDYIHRYTSTLKEFRNEIARTDTTVVTDHNITGTKQITIRKYYKVLEIERSDSEAAPTSADDQQDGVQKPAPTVISYLVPEFYYYVPKKSRDTTYEFFCYDHRDTLMKTVENYDSVKYYSLFKSYIDSNHTYKDKGEKKFLPVSSIVRRYDRIAKDRWMTIEYPKNKYLELTEYKNIVVSSDTITVVDPVIDKTILKVFNHYKVVK